MNTVDHNSRETLSALLDDAADDLELRRLLRDWEQLPESGRADLAATWSRYNLVHAALHGLAKPVSARLASRVSAAVAEEPGLVQRSGAASWQQSLAKVAVAASVALAVVLGFQSSFEFPATTEVADRAAEEATTTAPAATLVADSVPTEPSPLNAAEQGLVREYIGNIVIDPAEPTGFESIEDSPLYRLVNDLQVQD